MNKSDLINAIANDAGITKTQATAALQAFEVAVTGALADGNTVALVGFGTFSVTAKAARTGRNPKTGEPIQIAAKKAPVFKAGKALKDAVQ